MSINSLPPEIILEIYKKMDARTAYTFRKTCRDYNRVFLENPSSIARFDSTLRIELDESYKHICVHFDIPKSLNYRPHTLTIESGIPQQESEELATDFLERLLENQLDLETTIVVYDDEDGMIKIVAKLRTIFRFTEIVVDMKRYRHSYPMVNFLEDRILRMMVDHLAVDAVHEIRFESVDFHRTDIMVWHRLLRMMTAKSLILDNCRLNHDGEVFFPEDAVSGGMINLSNVRLIARKCESLEIVGLQNLLRNDRISKFVANLSVDCQEIIAKIERWFNDDFTIEKLQIIFPESERKTLAAYLLSNATCRQLSTANDYSMYEMTTRNRNRMATSIINNYYSESDSRFIMEEVKMHHCDC